MKLKKPILPMNIDMISIRFNLDFGDAIIVDRYILSNGSLKYNLCYYDDDEKNYRGKKPQQLKKYFSKI